MSNGLAARAHGLWAKIAIMPAIEPQKRSERASANRTGYSKTQFESKLKIIAWHCYLKIAAIHCKREIGKHFALRRLGYILKTSNRIFRMRMLHQYCFRYPNSFRLHFSGEIHALSVSQIFFSCIFTLKKAAERVKEFQCTAHMHTDTRGKQSVVRRVRSALTEVRSQGIVT